jgi:small-conductance mechanosensitive channel
MMFDVLGEIWANDVYRKLILSAVVLLASFGFRRLLHLLVVTRLPDDSQHVYTVRKVTNYLINTLVALIIFGIWVQRVGDLSIALGILGAGLAFALQEVIGSIAGWVAIITGRPFTIGDRVETGSIRGDVVDIGLLRTTLMEIGNWLAGDHNTGRIVTVSNAFIFKEPLFNYSRHLKYIWDEVSVPVTYESDWQRAIQIMIDAVQQHPLYQELLPRAQE